MTIDRRVDDPPHLVHEHPVDLVNPTTGGVTDGWERSLDCERCGLRSLALVLDSPAWVHRRVESVDFRDNRTIRRRVSIDFSIPPRAPVLRAGDEVYRLVPLAIMRRKTLIRFDFRDERDLPVPLLGLRQNQVLTRALLMGLASAVLRRCPDESVEQYITAVAAGSQLELIHAYRTAELDQASPLVRELIAKPTFKRILDRLAEDYVMFALVPDHGPLRRVYKYSYDEPLSLRYKKSGYGLVNEEVRYDRYTTAISRFSPHSMLASLGWRPTRIRFSTPAAENCRSFHFEVNTPPGVEIASATILAGRPNVSERPHIDTVGGGLPTVDLHLVDVERGSLSRAQVELQATRHPWLTLAVVACWLNTVILALSAWRLGGAVDPGVRGDTATFFVALGAAFAALLWRPADHRMVLHLIKLAGVLVSFTFVSLLTAAALFIFEPDRELRTPLQVLSVIAGVIALLMTVTWLLNGHHANDAREAKTVRLSPWEQGRNTLPIWGVEIDDYRGFYARHAEFSAGYETFGAAIRTYGFGSPAIKVASAEEVTSSFPSPELRDGLKNLVLAELAQPGAWAISNGAR